MGAVFENLTCEQLCDLMCGRPEKDGLTREDIKCLNLKCRDCKYLDEETTPIGHKCTNENRKSYKGKQVFWRLPSSVACVNFEERE